MLDQGSEPQVAPASWRPVRKVGSGGLAAAVATVIIWLIGYMGVQIPPELAAAITTIVGFVVAYLIPAEA